MVILKNPERHDELKDYITGVIGRFRTDRRIHAWDLFNEPDNPNRSSYGRFEPANKAELALCCSRKEFAWARSVNPTQPLTAGVWAGDLTNPERLSPINRFMLDQSDVISFHNYKPLPEMKRDVESLKRYGRPILMHRVHGPAGRQPVRSRSWPISSLSTWARTTGASSPARPRRSIPGTPGKSLTPREPPVWFHDIFRPDGTPYDAREVDYIRNVTGSRSEAGWMNCQPLSEIFRTVTALRHLLLS